MMKLIFLISCILTNRQVANLHIAFADSSSTDIKSSKTQLSKMMQSGGFLGRLLGPLLKIGLPLMKNLIKTWAKSVLILLGLTAATSVSDAGIHKKFSGSGKSSVDLAKQTTTLIISNDEMEDIIKKVKSLEDSGLLLKRVSETIQIKLKNKKKNFLVFY